LLKWRNESLFFYVACDLVNSDKADEPWNGSGLTALLSLSLYSCLERYIAINEPTSKMPLDQTCHAFASKYWCSHLDVLIYLAPSLALAVVIKILGRRHDFFILLYLAGTICHELAHYCVGLLTMARPSSFSVMPRRTGAEWTLGEVGFANLRWYNAAPIALAPFLILVIPVMVAIWRVAKPWSFNWTDLAVAFLIAPQFLSFWPSRQDWLLSLGSWPYLVLAGGGYWLLLR
jgi:hypothetical protein